MVSFADSGITSVDDFAGKQVGNWGFGNEFELTAAIEKDGIDRSGRTGRPSLRHVALLNGEIDVAEAMIYNEYAQVLEAENPDTGELYQPEDLNVIDFNDVGTAMLQDAVWAECRLDGRRTRTSPSGSSRPRSRAGCYCRDNFDACVQIVLDNGSTLGASHQAWQLNEINALILPATNGIGVMNETCGIRPSRWRRLRSPSSRAPRSRPTPSAPTWRRQAVERLEAEGFDVSGDGFEPKPSSCNPAANRAHKTVL